MMRIRAAKILLKSSRAQTLQLILGLFALAQFSCATQNCDLDTVYRQTMPTCEKEPCPPAPPPEGPGSGVSPHASVETMEVQDGVFDDFRSVIYVPSSPTPKKAPVILFLHGYFDAKPKPYDAMLRHYARKGYIVVYPSYGNPINPKKWADNAEEAMRRAVDYLNTKSPVKPDLKQVAYVGHSIGSILALHLAEREASLPKAVIPLPKLIIAMDGAGIISPAYPYLPIEDLSRIPSSTNLLLLMAQETYMARLEDPEACQGNAKEPAKPCNGFAVNKRAYGNTKSIPQSQKTAFIIPSDLRGGEGLRSEHNGAQGYCGWFSSKPIDAIDTWGYWKYTVAALDQILMKDELNLALLTSDRMRSTGRWSDGTAAKAPLPLESCLSGGKCPSP